MRFYVILVTTSAGLLFCSCLIFSRRMWMPISLHFSWDFFNTLIYGNVLLGVLPWFNSNFNAQKVDQFSAIFLLVPSIVIIALAVRKGQWPTFSKTICTNDDSCPNGRDDRRTKRQFVNRSSVLAYLSLIGSHLKILEVIFVTHQTTSSTGALLFISHHPLFVRVWRVASHKSTGSNVTCREHNFGEGSAD